MLFKLNIFPPIVDLNIQLYNTEIRSSTIIIKSIAQKQMAKYGFACSFHKLNYFSYSLNLL